MTGVSGLLFGAVIVTVTCVTRRADAARQGRAHHRCRRRKRSGCRGSG